MRYIYIILLHVCMLYVNKGTAQPLKNSGTNLYDSSKIAILLDTGKSYEQINPAKAFTYFRQGLAQSRAINNKSLIISSVLNIGVAYIQLDNFNEAIVTLKNLLPLAVSTKDTTKITTILIYIGNAYLHKNEKASALDKYLEAAHYLEASSNKKILPWVYANISSTFIKQKDFSKGLEYGKLSLATAEQLKDEVAILMSLVTLSRSYTNIDSLRPQTPQLLNRALVLAKKNNSKNDLYYIYNNLGEYYNSPGQEKIALENWLIAYEYAKELNNIAYLCGITMNLAVGYNTLNETDKAINYLNQSDEFAKSCGERANIKELFLTRAQLDEKQKNFREAYENLYKYIDMKDSMLTSKNNDKISEIEAMYQNEKKKAEIIKLQKDKEIQALSLKQQTIFVYIAIAAIIVLLVVLALLYRNYQQEQKLKEQQQREYDKNKQLIAIDAMLKGQEEERGRLARDLHDGLGGLLSGLKISLSDAKDRIHEKNGEMNVLTKSIDMIDLSVKEMRNVAHNLMPQALVKFGLDDALKDFCNSINTCGSNLKINYQSFGPVKRVENSTEIMIYRITQELLNNAIKHAMATEIIVQLLFGKNRLNITVEDNGTGFDTALLKTNKSAGWANILNRVNYLKGRLDLESEKGKGTHINIEFII